jgi:hypothetical protein
VAAKPAEDVNEWHLEERGLSCDLLGGQSRFCGERPGLGFDHNDPLITQVPAVHKRSFTESSALWCDPQPLHLHITCARLYPWPPPERLLKPHIELSRSIISQAPDWIRGGAIVILKWPISPSGYYQMKGKQWFNVLKSIPTITHVTQWILIERAQGCAASSFVSRCGFQLENPIDLANAERKH